MWRHHQRRRDLGAQVLLRLEELAVFGGERELLDLHALFDHSDAFLVAAAAVRRLEGVLEVLLRLVAERPHQRERRKAQQTISTDALEGLKDTDEASFGP